MDFHGPLLVSALGQGCRPLRVISQEEREAGRTLSVTEISLAFSSKKGLLSEAKEGNGKARIKLTVLLTLCVLPTKQTK